MLSHHRLLGAGTAGQLSLLCRLCLYLLYCADCACSVLSPPGLLFGQLSLGLVILLQLNDYRWALRVYLPFYTYLIGSLMGGY